MLTSRCSHSVRTNFVLVGLSLLLPLVWIILSAAKHSDVVDKCVTQFSSDNSSVDGQTICNIFTWIQLGVLVESTFLVSI